MAFDPELARQLRQAVATLQDVREQAMFGGICFLLRGHMICGVHRDRFMFRVGKEQDAEALARPGARPMDITGRPMPGFVFVDGDACDEGGLRAWVELAHRFVGALPKKERGRVA